MTLAYHCQHKAWWSEQGIAPLLWWRLILLTNTCLDHKTSACVRAILSLPHLTTTQRPLPPSNPHPHPTHPLPHLTSPPNVSGSVTLTCYGNRNCLPFLRPNPKPAPNQTLGLREGTRHVPRNLDWSVIFDKMFTTMLHGMEGMLIADTTSTCCCRSMKR